MCILRYPGCTGPTDLSIFPHLLKCTHHARTTDECDVYTSLVENSPSSLMQAMPNHHINSIGEVEGFRFTCDMEDSANSVPFGRRMFQCTTMVECENENVQTNSGPVSHENKGILELLLRQEELKAKLVNIVQEIHKESIGNEVTFDCMPDHSSVMEEGGDLHKTLASSYLSRRSADCRSAPPLSSVGRPKIW